LPLASRRKTKDRLIDLVEIPPNQKLDWHWHPGEELHYYLEGDPVIELADAPPIVGKPGHGRARGVQAATPGDCRGKGAKINVFRVHTKGAPWRYVDEAQDREGKSE